MPIVSAYCLPHPPLAVPAVGRCQEQGIRQTLEAFDAAAREIAEQNPQTLIFITPHSVMYSDYFHISPGKTATGGFERFGVSGAELTAEYDAALAMEIGRAAVAEDIPAGSLGEKDPALDHGVTVPLWFIKKQLGRCQIVRISQSGLGPAEHYRLGQCIAKAVNRLGRRAIVVASGDWSHKLLESGPYGYAPEGPEFDGEIARIFMEGDFGALFGISPRLRRDSAECGYGSFMVMAGCFDKTAVQSRLYSYEGPYGVGYGIASVTPLGEDVSRCFLERHNAARMERAGRDKTGEDAHRSLARQALEHIVKTGNPLPLPTGLGGELAGEQAGVFVSLSVDGQLRGCIGTIAPTTGSVAEEIIQNAASAGLSDSRFSPVTARELDSIVYKVDVLKPPEPVSGPEELDVKRYGVIVTSGGRRGLLLPNLDGVDTIEQQIDIARQKAGIPAGAPLTLQRFEVVRHE